MPLEIGLLIPPTLQAQNPVALMMAANERFLAAAAEHGLTAWFVDHLQFGAQPYLECLAQLAHAAGRHPGLRVGTLVLGQSYRNPATVAKIGATLKLLTGGRFILGIGAGWKEDEYRAYGYEFPSAAVRLEQLDEAIRIIRLLWTESPASFKGKHYAIEEARCEPRPVPPPILMVGGGGERRTLRIAAEHADWWNVDYIAPEEFARKLGILRGHCRAVGRDPESVTPSYFGLVSLARDPAKVLHAPPPNYPPTAFIVSGGPDEVAEKLRRFADLGARHVQLTFLDYPATDGLELFLSDVLPHFPQAHTTGAAA